jgi:hypothetical protein
MSLINEKYAELNNYSYIFETFNLNNSYEWEDLINDETNLFKLKCYFKRYELLEKYFNEFDYLVWLDSDIVINNPNIKIENLIDNEHNLFLCADSGIFAFTTLLIQAAATLQKYLKDNNLTYLKDPVNQLQEIKNFGNTPILKDLRAIIANPQGLNSGFMIFKTTNLIKDFLNDFKKYYPLSEHYFFDQGCLSKLLELKKYKNMYKVLPLELQGNPFYKHKDFNYNEDKNFICHYYGENGNTERLLNHINTIKNNKWWKK